MKTRPSSRSAAWLSCFLLSLAAFFLPQAALAGNTSITGTTPGATPFISDVTVAYGGGTVASVAYQILPKSGSFTRPLASSYTAQYLASTGALQATSATIPVWGLYAGYTNTVSLTTTFTDGSQSVQTINISTPSYTDPCTQLNSGTLTQQRVSTGDLNFDLFLLKTLCSGNAPTLIDTDGTIRWVGQPGTGTSSVTIYNNALFFSDGKSGILRVDLTTAAVTAVADYAAAPYNVTYTGHHNIDPGRNGLIVDVNTATQLEAANLEFNPNTGAVENFWDLGQIISFTMAKGGDDPTKFVFGANEDWFHNNATAYNPADNTLIVSSRENFVIAVDYDTPSDGQKKIHWILGDTSKAWYAFPSLRAFMLTPTNAATLPPIGQHAVSIDHNKNLLLFDDGFGSVTQQPAGNTRYYSAVREYVLDLNARTATAGSVYYAPNPTIYNDICGSVYDVNGTYLVDFPAANGRTDVYLQGLGSTENLVFSLHYPEQAFCDTGWNALPLPSTVFNFTSTATPIGTFTLSANPPALTLAGAQSGSVAITVAPQNGFTASVSFAVAGLPAGVTSVFSAPTSAAGSTLTLTAAPGTVGGTYPLTITGNSGSLVSSASVSLTIVASATGGLGATANVYSSFTDGTPVAYGGVDNDGYAYSANLLGSSLTFNGVTYTFGSPNVPNAAAATTLTLPAGAYANLKFLAAAVNGNQPSQTFTVTYTDGSTASFTQSISDWAKPQRYPGEVIADSTPYRIASNGSQQTAYGPFYLYAYTLPLNPAKTVKTLTLPNTRNVVLFAYTLVRSATPVVLGSAANVYSSFSNGAPVTNGGFDNDGYAYSANLLYPGVTLNGVSYIFGTPGTANAASGTTLALPAGNYAALSFLAAAANNNQTSQIFTVTYTDGSTATFTQSISDWAKPQNFPGETLVLSTPYRVASNGSQQSAYGPFDVYAYTIPLNPAKMVKSLTLPNTRNVVVLAASLSPSGS